MVVVRGLAAAAMAAVIAAAAYGCNSGLNSTDATVRCNEEQQGKADCFDGLDGGVYAACISCYERCGNDCAPQEHCPEQYLCQGDTAPDGG